MVFQDLLLVTLLNTGICICLPKILSVLGSINTRQSQKISVEPTVQEHPKPSQPDAYPELVSLAR